MKGIMKNIYREYFAVNRPSNNGFSASGQSALEKDLYARNSFCFCLLPSYQSKSTTFSTAYYVKQHPFRGGLNTPTITLNHTYHNTLSTILSTNFFVVQKFFEDRVSSGHVANSAPPHY